MLFFFNLVRRIAMDPLLRTSTDLRHLASASNAGVSALWTTKRPHGWRWFPGSPGCFAVDEQEELGELADWIDLRADLELEPLPGVPQDWPLLLHGTYSRTEILSATGFESASTPANVRGFAEFQAAQVAAPVCDSGQKGGAHERIAYHDYAISPERFHWQSQNNAGPDTASGRIYTQSATNGWRFQLFVLGNAVPSVWGPSRWTASRRAPSPCRWSGSWSATSLWRCSVASWCCAAETNGGRRVKASAQAPCAAVPPGGSFHPQTPVAACAWPRRPGHRKGRPR